MPPSEGQGGFTDTLDEPSQDPAADAEALVAGKLPQRHAVEAAVQKSNGVFAYLCRAELWSRSLPNCDRMNLAV